MALLLNGGCQLEEQRVGFIPSQASVRDALPVCQDAVRSNILTSADEMALYHQTDDPLISSCDLFGDLLRNHHLLLRSLATVGVAAIDHDPWGEIRLGELCARHTHVFRSIVGLSAPAQDDMAITIATGGKDRRATSLGHRQEVVWL